MESAILNKLVRAACPRHRLKYQMIGGWLNTRGLDLRVSVPKHFSIRALAFRVVALEKRDNLDTPCTIT